MLSLENLEYLDMSNNDFQRMQIPKFIGSLQNLRYLNLSNSNFSGEIPPHLGNLSTLNTLDLSYNFLSSNLQSLSGLSMLHNLDMTHADLSKASNWLQTINSLPSLVELRMKSCGLLNSSPGPSIFSDNSSSLFLLDLSDNPDLGGIVFRNMTSLRKLYISGNPFMNNPVVLTSLSSSVGSGLISLDISFCYLASLSIRHLRNVTSLVVLDLSYNALTKEIPKSLGKICILRELYLSYNNFFGNRLLKILENIFGCDSSELESLEISKSNVSGHLPEQIAMFQNLVNLDLSYNLLSGPIPYSIGSLSFLRNLDISDNQLNGSLPPSIGQLCELETMHLLSNMFSGMVTEDHFSNLTNLKELWADMNGLTLRLHSANWVPPFQLQVLYLRTLNLGTQFPLWLQLQTELQYLNIRGTGISDIIPNWFWTKNSDLRVVDISSNKIQGTISNIPPKVVDFDLNSNYFTGPFPNIPPTLEFLDLSCNNFSGSLPKIPPKLDHLDLRSNNFSGPLPMFLNSYLDLSSNSFTGSLKTLLCGNIVPPHTRYLNVSNNNLSGVIPQCWENWKLLQIIDLENNNFSGEIPNSLGYLLKIESLNMCNNNLVGKLPVSLMNLKSLKILQLSKNKLIGNIPSWLGRHLSELRILDLRSNKFSGHVSFELCHLIWLQVLDLPQNNLSGDVPTCFDNFNVMSGLEAFQGDILVGSFSFPGSIFTFEISFQGSVTIETRGREDRYSSTLGLVTMLDLSNNHFSGSIPNELMSLKALVSLSLSGNHFTGRIPDKIGDMKQIEYLDLSHNQLQGEIPMSLSNLNFLHTLDLSYNNLTGRIPTSTQIQGFDNSSFIGNRLCGPPLESGCVVETHDHGGGGLKVGRNTTHETDWGFIISILLGFTIGFWVVAGPSILSRWWRSRYFRIFYKVWFKLHDVIYKYIF